MYFLLIISVFFPYCKYYFRRSRKGNGKYRLLFACPGGILASEVIEMKTDIPVNGAGQNVSEDARRALIEETADAVLAENMEAFLELAK